jgi:predicted PhzF superfamily epimerase YddE/YHI9
LRVSKKENGWIAMNFPGKSGQPEAPPLDLYHGINGEIADEVYKADDFMLVFDKEEKIRGIKPNFNLLYRVKARGIIVTAPGNKVDFVSRFFAPSVGVNEDPVTGSAHTMLIPYWSRRLNKNHLTAAQLSARSGILQCKLLRNNRVEIAGRACTYLTGTLELPERNTSHIQSSLTGLT